MSAVDDAGLLIGVLGRAGRCALLGGLAGQAGVGTVDGPAAAQFAAHDLIHNLRLGLVQPIALAGGKILPAPHPPAHGHVAVLRGHTPRVVGGDDLEAQPPAVGRQGPQVERSAGAVDITVGIRAAVVVAILKDEDEIAELCLGDLAIGPADQSPLAQRGRRLGLRLRHPLGGLGGVARLDCQVGEPRFIGLGGQGR
jgi:hypothetical protein